MSVLYLYALLAEAPHAELGTGLAGEPLRLVPCGDLLAVTGTIETSPELAATVLRAHDDVVRRLATLVEAILPARFGTLAEDEHALGVGLEPRIDALREGLRLVRGCEQMSLRVFGVATGEEEVAPGDGPVSGPVSGPGARYLAERRRVHQRATALPGLEPLRRALGLLVRAERIEPHQTPPLLASVYHLVPRGAAAAYLERLEATRTTLGPWRVEASGPWPPYAFAPGPAHEVAA
jgi:hypothetical protein